MELILFPLLLASLFGLFYYLFVPSKYGYSPASAAKEVVLGKLQKLIAPDSKKLIMVNKTPEKVTLEVVSYGLLFGALGIVLAFVAVRQLNGIIAVAGIASVLLGMVIGKFNTDQLFKKWQGELLEGIPTFVDFFPALIEVEGVTPREALRLTLDNLPEPLYSEIWQVYNRIERTGEVREAFDILAERANHPVIESICLRLSNAWNARVTPDIFEDLQDEIVNVKKEAANRRTMANKASLAMVSVIGMFAVFSIFGYPAIKFVSAKIGGM